MRLCAGLTSAKLTPFSRSGTTGRTTDSEYLFGAELSLHGKKITPNRLRGWSILNSFGNYCIDGSPLRGGSQPKASRLRDGWETPIQQFQAFPSLAYLMVKKGFCHGSGK